MKCICGTECEMIGTAKEPEPYSSFVKWSWNGYRCPSCGNVYELDGTPDGTMIRTKYQAQQEVFVENRRQTIEVVKYDSRYGVTYDTIRLWDAKESHFDLFPSKAEAEAQK